MGLLVCQDSELQMGGIRSVYQKNGHLQLLFFKYPSAFAGVLSARSKSASPIIPGSTILL
jgi:hypothetical protein